MVHNSQIDEHKLKQDLLIAATSHNDNDSHTVYLALRVSNSSYQYMWATRIPAAEQSLWRRLTLFYPDGGRSQNIWVHLLERSFVPGPSSGAWEHCPLRAGLFSSQKFHTTLLYSHAILGLTPAPLWFLSPWQPDPYRHGSKLWCAADYGWNKPVVQWQRYLLQRLGLY